MLCCRCEERHEETIEVDGENFCAKCVDELFEPCAECGELVLKDDAVLAGDSNLYCEECINSHFVLCHKCEEYVWEDDATRLDGCWFCDDCTDDIAVECAECGEYMLNDEANYLADDDTPYCRDCYGNIAVQCYSCGDNIHRDDAYTDDNITLCSFCRREYYYLCPGCDSYVQCDDTYEIDGEYLCENCAEDCSIIRGYNYKPKAVFHGSGDPLFMGVELEIDLGGERNANAEAIIDPLGDLVYCKHDGSLCNGFEIVTHPMTLAYFYGREGEFRESFEEALRLGYRSHDTRTCGLHVHISRRFFEGEVAIAKLVYLFERFWPEIKKFSRRTARQIERWAQRYIHHDEVQEYFAATHDEVPEKISKLFNVAIDRAGKYCAVNLTPSRTVELRIFRGSLKYSTFAATIEFAHMIATVAKEYSLLKVHALTWEQILQEARKYKYLPGYLKERGLMGKDGKQELAS